MSKYVKQALANELQKKFTDVSEFVIVDMMGIDGITNNQIRGKLGDKGIKLTMVKNATMRRAMSAMGKDGAAGLFETGSCTVVYGGDSVVDLAKELKALNIGKTGIKFRGAYVDGAALDAAGASQLVNMKSRAELQGEVVMLANSPGRRLAGAIAAPAGIIAGCIKAIAEKAEKAAA
ncbi:MAG: 50S ribosomal protein L10 [Phycisphaerae bacterium]|nr:50S ribosomal protein L10 [Phycisphaerae bacterium]